ncbi:unnamed protein product [Brassica oleracea var. botrytis]
MASEPVNGEGTDGAREKQKIKVYTRKGKGQRKLSPFFAFDGDSREKPEGDSENNRQSPPQTLAQESQKSPVSSVATEAPSEKVIDKPLVEALTQAEPQDDASLAPTDKNVIQPVSDPLGQEDVNTVTGDKSVEVPSQSNTGQDDVNTVVVYENSIKESLAQEDVTAMIVDKKAIEAPSQTISAGDANTVVVDKNPIEVSSDEDVHVVDADNLIKESQRDAPDAQQPAGVTSDSAQSIHATATESMPMEKDVDGRIKMHVPSKSKQEKEEIRKKLEDQLNVVRDLVKKIEDKEGEIGAYNDSRLLASTDINNGGGRILPGLASGGLPREVIRTPRHLNQLSISVLENTQGVNEHVEKEKRTPKANQFYRTSEFLLGDKLPPAESNKKSKSSAKKHGGEAGHGFSAGSKVFKNCSALLERLMKHKHGWVFNAPVDVKGLGLHDYFAIIEHPMDLGTVKSALANNLYKSPREFAEDVRLTFHNAMTYNPPGQDVHIMAEVLLQMFEERWAVIEADYNRQLRFAAGYEMNLPASTMRSRLGPTMPPPPISVSNTMDWSGLPSDLQHPKPTTTPGRTPTSARTPALKKPKANEPNKRDMTYEEKQKLSGQLQNLPPEKLDAIVQIVNKRNTAVKLRDEEIEVDIDSVDPETLWELDRFVTNYKKGLSKKKRRAELAIQAKAEAERNSQKQMAPAPVAHEFSREGGNTGKEMVRMLSHLRPFPTNSLSRSLTVLSFSPTQQHKLWSGLDTWRNSPINDLRLWGPNGPLLPSSNSTSSTSHGLVSAAPSLADLGALVLSTPDPLSKSHISHLAFSRWRRDNNLPVGSISNLPSSPARPPKPLLVPTNEVPSPKDSDLPLNAYMLHNLAHIELNAIDLAWDTVARFSPFFDVLGRRFFDDFAHVADDESRHFMWCSQRLAELGFKYGDIPANNLLMRECQNTSNNVAARLAVIPLVQEARGLDAGPRLVKRLMGFGDHRTSNIVAKIAEEEVAHVAVGVDWFLSVCQKMNRAPCPTFKDLIKEYGAELRGPFNHSAREIAGIPRDWYDPSCGTEVDEGSNKQGDKEQLSAVYDRLTHIISMESENSSLERPSRA